MLAPQFSTVYLPHSLMSLKNEKAKFKSRVKKMLDYTLQTLLMNLQCLGMTHNTVYEIFIALFIVMILYILHMLYVLWLMA